MKPDPPAQSIHWTRRELMMAGSWFVTLSDTRGGASKNDVNTDASHVLNDVERASLGAFGDTLLPGAREAGIVAYVEGQLQSETPLLFLRYMDYPGPALDFYRDGLKQLEIQSLARFAIAFAEVSAEQRTDLVTVLSQKSPADWKGPPSPLFYFVVRNDAVDVCYGTEEGFRKLDVPYLALISPPRKW